MEDKKYDIYTGITKDGFPYLSNKLTFEHPTTIVKVGEETAIKSKSVETIDGEYLAVFAKGDSIIYRHTKTEAEINESN